MAASTGPNLGLQFGWALGEDGWNTGMDNNLKRLDAEVHLSVKDKDLYTPPGSPAAGDRYIVGPSPTGAWAGHSKDIAAWVLGAWAFYTPKTGFLAYVEDETAVYYYASSAWSKYGVATGGTHSLWIPPSAFIGDSAYAHYGTTFFELNGYAYLQFPSGGDYHNYAHIMVPSDLGAISAAVLYVANYEGTSAANTVWQLALAELFEGEYASDTMAWANTTLAPYADAERIKEWSLTLPSFAWNKRKAVKMLLARLATDAADTNPNEMRLLGMRLDYSWSP